MPWLESEVDALRHGVELYGTGAWAQILAGGGFHPKRSGVRELSHDTASHNLCAAMPDRAASWLPPQVDLKDKWRNLTVTHSPHPLHSPYPPGPPPAS